MRRLNSLKTVASRLNSLRIRTFGSENKVSPEYAAIIKEYTPFASNKDIFAPILPEKLNNIKELSEKLNPAFGKFENDQVSHYINLGILDPLWDLLNRKGSNWRQISSILTAECLGRNMKNFEANKDVYWLLGSIELIRLGTLICDDIEDQSDYRRTDLSLHKKYGIDVALNVGNFIYFYPHSRMPSSIPAEIKAQLSEIYFRALTLGHCGQNLDNVWRNSNYLPTERELFEMNGQKGFVRQLFMESLAALNGLDKNARNIMREFGHEIAIISQTHNDLINVKSSEYSQLKGVLAEDIYEGKKTLMVIRACQQIPESEKNWLLNFLCQKKEAKSEQEVRRVLQILFETKSVEYAENMVRKKLVDLFKLLDQVRSPGTDESFKKLSILISQTFLNF